MKEIVLIIGFNASGKTTEVKKFVDAGYHRVNRDEMGGTIEAQSEHARAAIKAGKDQIVLDNTYPTIKSRESIIQVGKDLGVPVRCLHMGTSFEDAQLNACLRQIERTGTLMMPEEFKKTKDPNLFPPVALFTYKNKFENKVKKTKGKPDKMPCPENPGKQTPLVSHGFSSVEVIPFVRVWPSDYTNSAIIYDCDDTIRTSTGAKPWPQTVGDVELMPRRIKIVADDGTKYDFQFGISNQSAIAKGLPVKVVEACFDKTNQLLGVDIPWYYCPHKIPPLNCYCRKPSSGLGALLITKNKLDPSKVLMVGNATSDKTFATRCGFAYADEKEHFA